MKLSVKNLIIMAIGIGAFCSCGKKEKDREEGFQWIIDRFDDIKILQYQVPLFDSLELNDKLLVYYLSEAAISGRDIIFDQNGRYNLTIRRLLEAIYKGYSGDRTTDDFGKFEKYLKKVWFANGIHHHYSTDKFIPEFSQEYFKTLISQTPSKLFPADITPTDPFLSELLPVIFDPDVLPKRVNLNPEEDMIVNSANNYYLGVTQAEAEGFYKDIFDPGDPAPVSYGLNSRLVKNNDVVAEQRWRVGGMYSGAIEKIIHWLELASGVASDEQKKIIQQLIAYYDSGRLVDFDRYNILWVGDTVSRVDFINGFIETYGDPLGYKGAWESLVNFRDDQATRRAEALSGSAQWFENNSPIDPKFKKREVKGISAKVVTAAMLGGDCYPATPIGINLPNSAWIRREHGSKSVTIGNITHAYSEASKGDGFLEEFMLRSEDRERYRKFGIYGNDLEVDLHECLGHGSGQLAPGVKDDELRSYGSTIEEARADLFALYYLGDEKLQELGLVSSFDVARAVYAHYIMNGMMTQLVRIQPGKDIEESHMRNRKIIAQWSYEKGLAEGVIEKVVQDKKTYIVVNDFEKLRSLFGELLREVQRIKSEGDYEAARALVEGYGVKVDRELHKEVLERYDRLMLEPYSGFVNPVYNPVMERGKITDVKIEYGEGYVEQMLRYSREYSFLPSVN